MAREYCGATEEKAEDGVCSPGSLEKAKDPEEGLRLLKPSMSGTPRFDGVMPLDADVTGS